MLLIEYIESRYGKERGNKSKFIQDNPIFTPQDLSRCIRKQYRVNIQTGEVYPPTERKIKL